MDRDLNFFVTVCRKPGLFLQSKRYETICAYIDGYDSALHGGCLVGFRHWLLAEGSNWNNLPWGALVRKLVFPSADPSAPLSDSESDKATQALAGYLVRYRDCLASGGLSVVYQRYNKWLSSRRDEGTADMRYRLRNA